MEPKGLREKLSPMGDDGKTTSLAGGIYLVGIFFKEDTVYVKYKNKKITYYSPSRISRLLDLAITSATDAIQCFCVDPEANFTRNRILPPLFSIFLIRVIDSMI